MFKDILCLHPGPNPAAVDHKVAVSDNDVPNTADPGFAKSNGNNVP